MMHFVTTDISELQATRWCDHWCAVTWSGDLFCINVNKLHKTKTAGLSLLEFLMQVLSKSGRGNTCVSVWMKKLVSQAHRKDADQNAFLQAFKTAASVRRLQWKYSHVRQ